MAHINYKGFEIVDNDFGGVSIYRNTVFKLDLKTRKQAKEWINNKCQECKVTTF